MEDSLGIIDISAIERKNRDQAHATPSCKHIRCGRKRVRLVCEQRMETRETRSDKVWSAKSGDGHNQWVSGSTSRLGTARPLRVLIGTPEWIIIALRSAAVGSIASSGFGEPEGYQPSVRYCRTAKESRARGQRQAVIERNLPGPDNPGQSTHRERLLPLSTGSPLTFPFFQ